MIASPSSDRDDWPAILIFPPRRPNSASASPIESYLDELGRSLAGQIDPALEANGIITPLGSVARAALLEAIGADLEAAVRDLMLSGIPRKRAEAQAIANLGPAALLGRDLMVARRRRAVEAWQEGSESVWWWLEPLAPIGVAILCVSLAAVAPTVAVIAGMAAEPHFGAMAVLLVPLVVGLFAWVAAAMVPTIGDHPTSLR
jgi:hypothetical protein